MPRDILPPRMRPSETIPVDVTSEFRDKFYTDLGSSVNKFIYVRMPDTAFSIQNYSKGEPLKAPCVLRVGTAQVLLFKGEPLALLSTEVWFVNPPTPAAQRLVNE